MKRMYRWMVMVVALCLCVVSAGVAEANEGAQKTVLPIVFVNEYGVSNGEEVEDMLYTAIYEHLGMHKDKPQSVDRNESQIIFENFTLERDLGIEDSGDNAGRYLRKQDLHDLGVEANADYVLLVNSKVTDQKVKTAWLALGPNFKYEVTAVYNVRLYSVAEDKYVFSEKHIVKENAAGSSSTERAFKKTAQKFIKKHLNLTPIMF